MIRLRPYIPVLCALALLLGATTSAAQLSTDDSLEIARYISGAAPGSAFPVQARKYLYDRLRVGDVADVRRLFEFMQLRTDYTPSPWLNPLERLAAETLLDRPSYIRDTVRLRSLLIQAESTPRRNSMFDDDLLQRLVELMRSRTYELPPGFDEVPPEKQELQFQILLVNHLITTGYRAREEINELVEEFVEQYPESGYAALARDFIHREYKEAKTGAAFSPGYGAGSFIGDIDDTFGAFYGPVLAGEFYYERVSAIAALQIAVATAPSSFVVPTGTWDAGDASYLAFTLDLGYEFRWALLGVTPLVGIAAHSLRSPDDVSSDGGDHRTGLHWGVDAGVLVGYRVAMDVGPHIDLRARFGVSMTALGSYSDAFSGALYYTQLGFALVNRPYIGGRR